MELSPEEGHSKYMYLGQIHTGAEAVQYFSKGIDVMLKAKDKQAQEVCVKVMLFCFTFVPWNPIYRLLINFINFWIYNTLLVNWHIFSIVKVIFHI